MVWNLTVLDVLTAVCVSIVMLVMAVGVVVLIEWTATILEEKAARRRAGRENVHGLG